MQIGYIRVSKSDGSQVLDLQRDGMITAGVDPERVYEDLASGRKDDCPGLFKGSRATRWWSGNWTAWNET
jgi:DNA invertase Pin-like site-specific DNA recombinase